MPAKKGKTTRSKRPIFIKVARLGGEVKDYALDGDRTVEAALENAELVSDDDERIRVNGRQATLETGLKNGDVVTVAGMIEGAF